MLASVGTNLVLRSVGDWETLLSYSPAGGTAPRSELQFTPDGTALLLAGANRIQALRVPLWISQVEHSGAQIFLHWIGGTGTYRVEHKTQLTDPWTALQDNITSTQLSLPVTENQVFYRVTAITR
jgi:hypothetical protein